MTRQLSFHKHTVLAVVDVTSSMNTDLETETNSPLDVFTQPKSGVVCDTCLNNNNNNNSNNNNNHNNILSLK